MKWALKWAWAAACLVALGGAGYLALQGHRSCPVRPVVESWSSDHACQATLLEKICGEGDSIFYSLKVEKPEPGTASGGWYFVWDIESDTSDAKQPSLQWDTPTQLRLEAGTERLSGRLESHIHDFTLVRVFSPSVGPGASQGM
jgi:hypothetical protein